MGFIEHLPRPGIRTPDLPLEASEGFTNSTTAYIYQRNSIYIRGRIVYIYQRNSIYIRGRIIYIYQRKSLCRAWRQEGCDRNAESAEPDWKKKLIVSRHNGGVFNTPNGHPFGSKSNRCMVKTIWVRFDATRFGKDFSVSSGCVSYIEQAIFLFPLNLNGIWSWWQISFRFWTKWISIWFKLKGNAILVFSV